VPPLAFTLDEPTLLGIAAVVSAAGGVASTIMALRKSQTETEEHVLDELEKCRAKSEQLAKELHELRMAELEG
jgi:hypothetical protein